MRSRLGNDVKRLKGIARGVFTFLRNHYRSGLFQTGDLSVDMQHLWFEKRRAITSDDRACVGRCTQRARLDAQRSASNPEQWLRAHQVASPFGRERVRVRVRDYSFK